MRAFITGTDTGVGKTFVTALLARALSPPQTHPSPGSPPANPFVVAGGGGGGERKGDAILAVR